MAFFRSYYSILLFGAIVLPFFMLRCNSNKSLISPIEKIQTTDESQLAKEKIELGRKLFFDRRLSSNETVSCASCHVPEYAFTDRKPVSEGIFGRKTQRNSPSILNAALLKTVMFDAHLTSLEMQAIVPIQEHVEMDMKMQDLIKRLKNVNEYQLAAKKIFNRDFDPFVLTRSIAAFERSLKSSNSKFDQYMYQNKKNAISKDELAGWKIFSEKLYCTNCHPAPDFTTYEAENNGLYYEFGEDKGRFRIFNDSTDIGKFKVPSLRNIELTFPYMHDGSLTSIDQIIDHYSVGGKKHPLQNSIIKPFELTENEKTQLKKFLFSLTDTSYMSDFR